MTDPEFTPPGFREEPVVYSELSRNKFLVTYRCPVRDWHRGEPRGGDQNWVPDARQRVSGEQAVSADPMGLSTLSSPPATGRPAGCAHEALA